MKIQRQTGEYKVESTTGEEVRAYIPKPLPPDPSLDLTGLYPLLDRANHTLGKPLLETVVVSDFSFIEQ